MANNELKLYKIPSTSDDNSQEIQNLVDTLGSTKSSTSTGSGSTTETKSTGITEQAVRDIVNQHLSTGVTEDRVRALIESTSRFKTGMNILMDGYLKSQNFYTGVSGWQIDADGNVEFGSGYFRGDITGASGTFTGTISGGSIDIGGADTSSLHVDTGGNLWLGAATYDIATNPFAVSNAGLIRATLGTIGGTTITATELYGGIIKTAATVSAGNNGVIMDSILGDVPVIIRRSKKWIDIIPIMELHKKDSIIYKDGFKNIEVLSAKGWTKIKYSYRHKVKKQGYDVILGGGRTKVTEDHSLIQNGEEIKPKDLKIGDTLDIFKPEKYDFVNFPKELAWILGLFVAEGSLCKRKTHLEGSIANFNEEILNDSEEILKNFFCMPVCKGKTKISFYGQVADFFKQCYSFSSSTTRNKYNKRIIKEVKIKKIPIQILNGDNLTKIAFLDGYLAGDGHICKGGQETMDSKELSIVAGLQYLYSSLNVKTSVVSRNDKLNITTLNTLKGSHPVNKTTRKIPDNEIKKIRQFKIDDFVYDLETESHTFVAGVGYLVHHNTAGLRGYDSILGKVFDIHTDGSAPEFAFGNISNSIFEINTNAILRTSATVGDGSASSAGILINDTGLYACEASQTLANANVKILIDGSAVIKMNVKGGQTDFATGTGYFLGLSGGAYKLSIGSPAGNYMTWDGQFLKLRGSLDVGVNGLINNSVYTNATLPIAPTIVGFNVPSAYE